METLFLYNLIKFWFCLGLRRTLLYGDSSFITANNSFLGSLRRTLLYGNLSNLIVPFHVFKFKKNIVVWKPTHWTICSYLFLHCLRRTLLYGNFLLLIIIVVVFFSLFKKNIVVWKQVSPSLRVCCEV